MQSRGFMATAAQSVQTGSPIAAPSVHQQSITAESAAEKIKRFLNTVEGIGTLFSILAGVTVAALWGVEFGLLAAGIGILASGIAGFLYSIVCIACAREHNLAAIRNIENRQQVEEELL